MNPKKILIVDDDIELCEELKDTLLDEGYITESINEPALGESAIREGGHDLILLDCKMPQISGMDILKNLKRDNVRKNILIVSGRPFVEKMLSEDNLTDMIKGVVSKPIDLELLLKMIKELP